MKAGVSHPIAAENRTVSIEVTRQLLGDGLDMRIWDFAGRLCAINCDCV
jgi:hypothetical protein